MRNGDLISLNIFLLMLFLQGVIMRWTNEETERIEKIYPIFKSEELVEFFPGRTQTSIQRKSDRLGLVKKEGIYRAIAVDNVQELDIDKVSDNWGYFISGFVCGDGSFVEYEEDGTQKFAFKIETMREEKELLDQIKSTLGCGSIYTYDARSSNTRPTVMYIIQDTGNLYNRVIPFFEEFSLQETRKDDKYRTWKANFKENIPEEMIETRKYFRKRWYS